MSNNNMDLLQTNAKDSRQLTKAEIKQKLKDKIAGFKNHQSTNKQPISEKITKRW